MGVFDGGCPEGRDDRPGTRGTLHSVPTKGRLLPARWYVGTKQTYFPVFNYRVCRARKRKRSLFTEAFLLFLSSDFIFFVYRRSVSGPREGLGVGVCGDADKVRRVVLRDGGHEESFMTTLSRCPDSAAV